MFDKLFGDCKPISLYGPHGLRSGLGLLLRVIGVDDAEIMRFIYWKSLESLDLYTYGIELSEARKNTKSFLTENSLDLKNLCIREILELLLSSIDTLRPLFEDFRKAGE